MQYVLLYEDNEGNLVIVEPDPKFQHIRENTSDAIMRLHNEAIPQVAWFFAVKKELMPTDQTFRRAWRLGDLEEPVKIHDYMAMLLHRERLQIAANRKIEALEKEYEDAVKRQDKPKQVACKASQAKYAKIPEDNLSHCKTVEDIKYAIPEGLKEFWTWYPPDGRRAPKCLKS